MNRMILRLVQTILFGLVQKETHGVLEEGTILKSTDAAGTTFTAVHSITNARRTEIAVSGTNANTVYVLAQVRSVDGFGEYNCSLFKYAKKQQMVFSNTTTLTLPSDADTGIPNNDFTRGQAFL